MPRHTRMAPPRLAAALWAALLLCPLALPAQAQEKKAEASKPKSSAPPKTLDQLLQEVNAGRRGETAENRRREAEFRRRRDQQQQLLNQARREKARQEARSERLEASFQKNEREVGALEKQLQERIGSLGELFGVVRQVAGETRGLVTSSLVSAQFPGREAGLSTLAQSRNLPTIDQLEDLWYALQQEITESGKAVRFEASVVLTDGSREQREVTRVGVFSAISDGDFLEYGGGLKEILRQPGGRFTRAAAGYENADEGRAEAPIDPSKGQILTLLVQQPSATETISQGGLVGGIIIIIGLLGVALSVWRFLLLAKTGAQVALQVRSEKVRNNPLGRVMKVYEDNPDADAETLELRLDEAILREVPKLEKGLTTIKVFSVIAPLLGLLGTVTGMIETFQMITLFGTGDPKLMAGGISEALVTTMLGLIVAIPLTFLHSLVSSRSKGIAEVIEEQSAGMVARRAEAATAA